MSLKAYEDACIRAELFGQPLPDKEEFLQKHKHLDVVEFEDIEIRTATENTAMLDDDLKHASGGLTELNTILNSTQNKLNKLKGVCGTLTNFFRVKLASNQNLSYSSDQSYIGQTNYDKDSVLPQDLGTINEGLGPNDNEMTPKPGTSGAGMSDVGKTKDGVGAEEGGKDINTALDALESMEKNENTSFLSKAAVSDLGRQMKSQMSKLDSMIHKAERAETSLQQQNKQIRSFLK